MRNVLFVMFLSLAFFCYKANAQVVTGMRGEPVQTTEYAEVEGTPYLVDDWLNGSVILDNNQKAVAKFKFDISAHALLFQGKNGETLELKSKFTSFTLNSKGNDISNITPMVFVNNYPSVDKQTESSFYQLIADGKTKLLKYYNKIIDERSGSTYTSTVTRKFKLTQAYYAFKNNQLIEIQPNKKAVAKLFDDHTQQLDTYLKTNNISFKSDMDLQKLFTWYNSLN